MPEFLLKMLKEWEADPQPVRTAPCGCKVQTGTYDGEAVPLMDPCDQHLSAVLAATTALDPCSPSKTYLN